ncbi:MAG TPA: hypothetical protein HPQ03_07970 [Deltaproteobacteria bacterium]|nr:hypothetical protein [Deltaproteobacteria bacterium]
MEDIERDIQKALKDTAFTKPKKRSKHWTLLFVGDQGKVIRIRSFKFLVVAWISAIFTTTAAAATFFYLYQEKTKEMVSLNQVLTGSQKRAKSLRDEKDILMARIVVAESKIKSGQSKLEQKKVDETPKPKPEPIKETSPLPAPEPARSNKTVEIPPPRDSIETDDDEEQAQETIAQESDKEGSLEVVAIDDFFALIEEDSNTLRVKYKIRNASQSSRPVSGRTFMILKGKEEDQKNWLVFPEASMASGKPSQINNGRSFSITRFKTIRFKAPYQNGDKPFSSATILVYSTAGELLLEKSFPIKKGGENSIPTN